MYVRLDAQLGFSGCSRGHNLVIAITHGVYVCAHVCMRVCHRPTNVGRKLLSFGRYQINCVYSRCVVETSVRYECFQNGTDCGCQRNRLYDSILDDIMLCHIISCYYHSEPVLYTIIAHTIIQHTVITAQYYTILQHTTTHKCSRQRACPLRQAPLCFSRAADGVGN